MDRARTLLAAGGMTGLVLATLLALGFAPEGQATATGSPLPSSTLTTTLDGTTALSPEGSTDDSRVLLEQNRQLKQALELMQIREGQYREQIEQANLTLKQSRSAAAANPSDGRRYGRDGEYEDGEYEDGEYEDGEYEDGGSHDRYEDEREHEYDD